MFMRWIAPVLILGALGWALFGNIKVEWSPAEAQAQSTAANVQTELTPAQALANAAWNDDGMTMARQLEQAGACEWRQLVNDASAIMQTWGHPNTMKLSVHSTLNGDNETITVSRVGWTAENQRIQPLATVSATRCDRR